MCILLPRQCTDHTKCFKETYGKANRLEVESGEESQKHMSKGSKKYRT